MSECRSRVRLFCVQIRMSQPIELTELPRRCLFEKPIRDVTTSEQGMEYVCFSRSFPVALGPFALQESFAIGLCVHCPAGLENYNRKWHSDE